jgi:hypothetical protein
MVAVRYRRRRRVRFFFIVPVGLIVVVGAALVRSCQGPVSGDFRDTSVLARAVEQGAQQHGDGTPVSASCVQLAFPQYFCSVAFLGGVVGNYNVEVAVDGSSWHTT